MSRRNYIEWSQFSDPDSGMELLRKSIRDGLKYDAFNDQRVWKAMVLSPCRRLTDIEAAGYGVANKTSEGGLIACNSPSFKFKARLLGDNSPHLTLPDPCNLHTNSDRRYVEALIELHMDVIFTATGTIDPPNEGDIIIVQLKHSDSSYDLQIGTHIKTVARNTSEESFLGDQGCSLKFENFDDADLYIDQPLPTGGANVDIVPLANVVISKDMQEFLVKLRNRIPKSDINMIQITSGVRTPEAQARALKTKREVNGCNGGIASAPASGSPCKPIYDLYRNKEIVMEILGVPNETGLMKQVLQRQVASKRFMSPHMKGRGIDFRTRDLSQEQINKIIETSRSLGGTAIYEPDPPHIHVSIPSSASSNTPVANSGGPKDHDSGAS
tara:strand:+ start:26120 stop:27271 length:1152 start_codon:yes stop_codon:yes gene_type:complete